MSVRSTLRRPLAVLAGAAAFALPLASLAQQAYVRLPTELYAGPASDYPVVARLYPGVRIDVIGCLPDYSWCDLLLSDGLRGWAYGPGLAYDWMGSPLPLAEYGPSLGVPIIGFTIGDYWARHYRQQPWYGDSRWRAYPPPVRIAPPPVPAPPPHWGGQAPYPPRWQPQNRPEHDDGPGWRGNPPPMPMQPPSAQPPRPQPDMGRPPPPRPERNDGPRFSPVPSAAPGGPANPAPPRDERRFAPPPPQPNAGIPERPRDGDGRHNRFGDRQDMR